MRTDMLDPMTKDVVIQVRLSTDEHKAWTAAAELEQLPLAAWIRRRCNGLSAVAPAVKSKNKGGK
jgi:hypothetical protein